MQRHGASSSRLGSAGSQGVMLVGLLGKRDVEPWSTLRALGQFWAFERPGSRFFKGGLPIDSSQAALMVPRKRESGYDRACLGLATKLRGIQCADDCISH